MKKQISQSEFVAAFDEYNRSENFSVEAREMIYDYLEECDPDSEMDVIAVCCEFNEATFDEVIRDYNIVIEDEDNLEEEVMEYLNDNTSVVDHTFSTVVFVVF